MPGTVFYQPFVSTSVYVDSALNSLQGVKKNNLAPDSYLLTGTTGSAISPPGYGALYIGAIDGSSTSSGSGSGTWYNFSVPSTWNPQETSVYGPDILTSGDGPGGIGDVDLAGTWIDASGVLLGFYYRGSLSALNGDASGAVKEGFQRFQAKTRINSPADFTYLHSVDGGYVVGNYTTSGGPLALAINSGPGSGSFVFDPRTSSQVDIQYSDESRYHSAFGIWANDDATYTISGGASSSPNLLITPPLFSQVTSRFDATVKSEPGWGKALDRIYEALPDAVLGSGMLADLDPITGVASNVRHYSYLNRCDVITHFQGIDYLGGGVYQAPFVAVELNGQVHTGNAYMKRLDDGQFAKDAVWQTFGSDPFGAGALISTSVAENVNTGVYSTLAPFASIGATQPYFAAAQNLFII